MTDALVDALARVPVFERGTGFTIRRVPSVVVVHLEGAITDPVSDAWRAACQRCYDVDGWPPFGFVHAVDGQSVGSLQGKLRSAAFMRRSAERLRRIALVSNAQGSFVIKSVMRVAGAANVELLLPDRGAAVLDAMCAGRDPFE